LQILRSQLGVMLWCIHPVHIHPLIIYIEARSRTLASQKLSIFKVKKLWMTQSVG
jgi:hypothetical protein